MIPAETLPYPFLLDVRSLSQVVFMTGKKLLIQHHVGHYDRQLTKMKG